MTAKRTVVYLDKPDAKYRYRVVLLDFGMKRVPCVFVEFMDGLDAMLGERWEEITDPSLKVVVLTEALLERVERLT